MFKSQIAGAFAALFLAAPLAHANPTDAGAQGMIRCAQKMLERVEGIKMGMAAQASAQVSGFQEPVQGQRTVVYSVPMGPEINTFDKEILELQIPNMERYFVTAADKFRNYSQNVQSGSLPSPSLFYQACADITRAAREIKIALEKTTYAITYQEKRGELELLGSDLLNTSAQNGCPRS